VFAQGFEKIAFKIKFAPGRFQNPVKPAVTAPKPVSLTNPGGIRTVHQMGASTPRPAPTANLTPPRSPAQQAPRTNPTFGDPFIDRQSQRLNQQATQLRAAGRSSGVFSGGKLLPGR
jgi:hypothetical protein